MRRLEMEAKVQDELCRYESGSSGSGQRAFRMIYTAMRRNSLGGRPEFPDSPDFVEGAAARMTRESYPDFLGPTRKGNP